MPWLSARHPIGASSPLVRFVIGLDEALKDYPGMADDPSTGSRRPSEIPGMMISSFRTCPCCRRVRGLESNKPMDFGRPRTERPASLPDHRALPASRGNSGREEPRARGPELPGRFDARFRILSGGVLAGIVLTTRMVAKRAEEPQ